MNINDLEGFRIVNDDAYGSAYLVAADGTRVARLANLQRKTKPFQEPEVFTMEIQFMNGYGFQSAQRQHIDSHAGPRMLGHTRKLT